ncbi:hypothetical protein FDP41_013178 [Naegleria fowleri]|uniref:TLC domain-containing protein n=1 Tax=Naegleria fowleri TaxID=5763 RepID=A0A6A5C5C3_NAEFO|nr:uncharacterized protein FDP41_013178 [Naegleria fowleri]KAF0980695.1 hypothetical protein FDP41_013178 [Naegleria fowleri]
MEFMGEIFEKEYWKYCYFHSPTFIEYNTQCTFLTTTPMPYNVLFIAACSFVFCYLFEQIVKLICYKFVFVALEQRIKKLGKPEINENHKIAFYNKVISYTHAWFSTIAAIYVLVNEPTTWGDAAHGWVISYEVVLGISVGYFVHDLIFTTFRYPQAFPDNTSMIIHHLVCILGILYCLNFRIGVLYCITLLITEITTPFLQHRWFMEFLHYEKTIWFKLNGVLFWLMFLVCRVIWCFVQNVHIFYHADQYNFSPYHQRVPIILPSLLFLLNLFWFMIITKIVVKMAINFFKGSKTVEIPKDSKSAASHQQ